MTEDLGGANYESSPPDLRLILLGTIGCGKTASGDTILGQLSPPTSSGSSRSCQVRRGFSEGRRLTLVEAPRWYWNGSHMEAGVRKETERALTLAAPGPHAFLLLVPVGQFTEIEGRVPAELEKVFGDGVLGHTLVLLTSGDYLMGQTEQEYLQGEDPGLREVIGRCGGRYHIINNRRRHNREQVRSLLAKVENLAQRNGGCYLKTTQQIDLERRVKEREQELRERYRVQMEEKRQPVESRPVADTEAQRDGGEREEHWYDAASDRRREEERRETEERVTVRPKTNGLNSSPAPESQPEAQNGRTLQDKRSSSFRLNADGAILSQLSEVQPTEKIITTFHHRLNSVGERSSPEASPASSPRLPLSPSSFSSRSSSYSSSSSSSPELRLVLLGRSGAGKSAAGNSILGREEFESRTDLTAVTQECGKRRSLVGERTVAVVDTPDWFQSEHSPDEVRAQISSCVALSAPGPHAFLLCVPVDQPATTELQALGVLEAVFGPEVVRTHTLVLFTHADRLRESGKAGDNGVEAYIAGHRGDLLKLVEKCGDRFHVMERGGGEEERRNVAELLEKVEQTVREGGGRCYSCPAFQEAEEHVRRRQAEIAKERKGRKAEPGRVAVDGRLKAGRRSLSSSMQPLTEAGVEEDVREDEIEEMRDEAEKSVSAMNLESLPLISSSTLSPSLMSSIWEKFGSMKTVPKMLADSSVWVSKEAKKVAASPMWGKAGTGAKNVQKMVFDSSVWEKVKVGAGGVSKPLLDNSLWEKIGSKNAPKWMADSSTWVGSGAKNLAQSPMWGKLGSGAKTGAKMMADGSVRVGAGIGTGAKNLAQSPMWGKVGSGAKTGAKMVADGSVRVGAGIGAGAKKVAKSPVWGKVGSGARAGAKMVAESSLWERVATVAKKVPMVVLGGALLGLVLGVVLGGVMGGAVGTAVGSVVSEVGRQKFSNQAASEDANKAPVRRRPAGWVYHGGQRQR
ncbi:uncharacterized protein ACJ7VT_018105 [Polymixia lowei]